MQSDDIAQTVVNPYEAEPGALPQLFHCTAGKDRTGFAAALVLLSLGVDREQVMVDFLLSNYYLAGNIESGVNRVSSVISSFVQGYKSDL